MFFLFLPITSCFLDYFSGFREFAIYQLLAASCELMTDSTPGQSVVYQYNPPVSSSCFSLGNKILFWDYQLVCHTSYSSYTQPTPRFSFFLICARCCEQHPRTQNYVSWNCMFLAWRV